MLGESIRSTHNPAPFFPQTFKHSIGSRVYWAGPIGQKVQLLLNWYSMVQWTLLRGDFVSTEFFNNIEFPKETLISVVKCKKLAIIPYLGGRLYLSVSALCRNFVSALWESNVILDHLKQQLFLSWDGCENNQIYPASAQNTRVTNS